MPTVTGAILVSFDAPPGPQGTAGPPGPAGAGLLKQRTQPNFFTPGQTVTTTASFVGIGVTAGIMPSESTSRIVVTAEGIVNHSDDGAIVHFALLRNGTVTLLPTNASGISDVRCISSSYAPSFRVEWDDSPGTTACVSYQLACRVHGGTATIGKRASDSTMYIPTRIYLQEIL